MLSTNYSLTNQTHTHIYIYIYDLALNNLQGLICHKKQPNQSNSENSMYMRDRQWWSTQVTDLESVLNPGNCTY